ncbi:Sjoegren syndrome nuclear autoantigen 1 like protein, partial [Cyphomyrmex costatus]
SRCLNTELLYKRIIRSLSNVFEKKIVLLGLEEMKIRRSELQAQIESQEEEKNNLQREIEKMSCKLTQLNDSLAKRITVRNEYDRTIADTEAAYVKILESSQLLLNMIKKEAVSLDQTLGKANIDKQYR